MRGKDNTESSYFFRGEERESKKKEKKEEKENSKGINQKKN